MFSNRCTSLSQSCESVLTDRDPDPSSMLNSNPGSRNGNYIHFYYFASRHLITIQIHVNLINYITDLQVLVKDVTPIEILVYFT
jgi:hypothetical protein